MNTKLNPYIAFDNQTKEAMDFYKSVFGGKLTLSTFKEGGMSSGPEQDDKIMHAQLITDNGMTIMGAEMNDTAKAAMASNISLSLSGDNEDELSGYFNKLAEGGNVTMPLAKAPWGDTFGMVTDKFGTKWMVNVAGSQAAEGAQS